MPAFSFNRQLKSGKVLIGTMLTLRSFEVAEITAAAGFDWLFVDGEHGPIEAGDLQLILQAVANRSAVLFRVPAIEETVIKRALDLGVQGLIVPQVNSVEQVKKIIEFAKYPPAGNRGIGLGRAHQYGRDDNIYLQNSNDEVSIVIQAEHVDAVDQIDNLIRVPGVDAVMVGPYDLSASLGVTGQVDHPQVIEAIEVITVACQKQRMPLGIFGTDAEAVAPYVAKGFRLIVAGIDCLILTAGTDRLQKDLRALC